MKSLKRQTILIILILITLLSIFQWNKAPENRVLSNGTRLEWTPCWFQLPFLPLSKSINCAYLFPSNKKQPIQLPVVVIKNRFWNHQSGPILYLSGGPGYPTGLQQDDIEFWLTWLEFNNWPHDLVLFDPRGTGLSQPQPQCSEIMSLNIELLGQSLTLKEELSLTTATVEQCYRRLRDSGIELSAYTTTNNSRDVGDLMTALGGTDWNLYGVSYGTRLALSVMRDYPEHLRSVILDSVYPPEINDLLETPFVYDNALATLFKGCQTDEECHSSFPNLELSFQKLLKQLHQAPIELMISRPDSEQPLNVIINDYRFIDIVFQALYRWDFIAILPIAIESAQRGDYKPLTPLIEDYVAWLVDTDFNEAVFFSVECHDSFPETTQESFIAQVARFPRIKAYVENAWNYNLCHIWKVNYASPNFRKPVTSRIPTLLLSGEYDPVTPQIWAKNAAKHLEHGHFFLFPGIGHGVIDSDSCASELALSFLKQPQKKPYHDCLSELSGSEFVLEDE
ncbi:MAG TPA: hypothetical protein DCM38_03750 [Gammaproteobacteria bacterium]|nr:hypothetical protein [Gammaproteobacteria bacterium]